MVVQFGTQTFEESDKQRDAKSDVPAERKSIAADAEPKETDKAKEDEKPDGDKAKKAPLVRSGIVKDPSSLERKPALLDVPIGKGRALLFSWNPAHRFQNHHDLGYLMNALLFFNDMPGTPTREEMHAREAKE